MHCPLLKFPRKNLGEDLYFLQSKTKEVLSFWKRPAAYPMLGLHFNIENKDVLLPYGQTEISWCLRGSFTTAPQRIMLKLRSGMFRTCAKKNGKESI